MHEGVGQLDHEEAGAELTAAAVVPGGSGNQAFAREKSRRAYTMPARRPTRVARWCRFSRTPVPEKSVQNIQS